MSYEFYKVLHLIGIMSLMIGLASVATLAFVGQLGSKAKAWGFATHGLGLLLIIVSGFGMAARLHLFADLPNWVKAKIAIWFLLALAVSLLKRKSKWFYFNSILILALGSTAAWLAIFKPF